jgi:hypothetical protein
MLPSSDLFMVDCFPLNLQQTLSFEAMNEGDKAVVKGVVTKN